MRRLSIVVLAVGLASLDKICLAHEVATHEDMSEAAVFASVLINPTTLAAGSRSTT